MDNFLHKRQNDLMRFIDNEMSEDERQLFTNEVSADNMLKAELDNLQQAKNAVLLYGINQEVSAIRKERSYAGKATPVVSMYPFKRFIRYGLAAAACILLVFFTLYRLNTFSSTPANLYAEKFTTFEPANTRGATLQTTPLENAYFAKDYKQVTALFQTKSSFSNREKIMAGVAFLQSRNPDKAIQTFNNMINTNEAAHVSAYNDEAKYYLALAYLKNKNYAKAIILMENIQADKGSAYSSKFDEDYISRVSNLR